MNPTQLKPLNTTAIQVAAEYLMTLNGQTNTLEVKSRLRSQRYNASQREVSQGMSNLSTANPRTWEYTQTGKYRSYSFKADTDENMGVYLEKGNLFWAVSLKEKAVVFEEGKRNKNGVFKEEKYGTNRKAVFEVKAVLREKKLAGFVETTDKRLPLKIRRQFAPYFNKKLTGCIMGFFEAEKLVQQSATFEVNGQKTEGYLLLNKSAGYTFDWELPKDEEVVKKVLESKKWDALRIGYQSAKLLGEKIKDAEAFDGEGVELREDSYQLLEKKDDFEAQAILVNNENLYKIECLFEGGGRVVLSKFQMDLEEEILPMMKWLICGY